MGREKNGPLVLGGQAANQCQQVPHTLRVNAQGGLIHDNHTGVLDEHIGNAQPLAHTAGIGTGFPVSGILQPHPAEQAVNAGFQGVAAETVEPSGEPQIFPSRHVSVKAHIVGQISHHAFDGQGFSGAVVSGNGGGALGGLCQTQEHQRGCGLACAVGSQQTEHLAPVNGQVQLVHRHHRVIAFGEAVGFNDDL